jgi:ketosteroid isomerase-like protein
MDRADVTRWIDEYERAWRTESTDVLADLFTEDATYSMDPYGEVVHGLAAISELWNRERVSASERFTMTSSVVAVDGDKAVARIEVEYLDQPRQYRDLWIIQFATDGRCRTFEEWPYWPGKFDELKQHG